MTKKKIHAEERVIVPVVTITNQKILTNSLNVAGVFGKLHKNVLQAISNLDVPEEFNRLNFQPSEFIDSTGRKLPMINLTRDGFTILAMGFTGPKAMKFKLAYIEAFNAMEAELLRQKEEAERPRIESGQDDPARLAESLMKSLIASLSGRHNDKIDDLGCEIVSRLQNLADHIAILPDRDDLLPALEVLKGTVSNLRRQLISMLPKLSIPDDLIHELRTVAARLTAIADQQDNANFAFHERLRAIEMRYRGVELNQTARLIGDQPGIMDYVEGNVPASLRHTFNLMRVPKAAGATMMLRFMNECLIPEPESRIETQRLYPVYCAWCFANMNSPVPVTSYNKLLREFTPTFKGMTVKMENYVSYLIGARIRIPREIKPESQDAPEKIGETPEGRDAR